DLGFPPVRAVLDDRTEILVKEARVNYVKLQTVEHNVPLLFIGRVVPEDFERIVSRVLLGDKETQKLLTGDVTRLVRPTTTPGRCSHQEYLRISDVRREYMELSCESVLVFGRVWGLLECSFI
ncbi:hypothetical protein C8A05DRAFT_17127, partial [Staphylotrichum tortipilum]